MRYNLEKPVVSTITDEKYRCHVEWRNGSFIADEPVKYGGGDTGPDPYTLLLSALASCKIVTLRMFIEKEGWNVPTISAAANLFQVRKEDEMKTTIDCDITFPDADLNREQRDRLLKVAEKCPVSKIIKGEAEVRTFVFHDERELSGKTYANDSIAVEWKPSLCQHSGRCVSQLPGVFKLKASPWINVDGASADALAEQVHRCPTGALTLVDPK
ncbi:(4Fe-4S)-binding protein [Flavobacterium sp.]|uniref:(4Fe-4S)-binding protein n=1 Tax=Flavobacterium sp. TaxID=239 RepID=UPI0011F9EB56|nr:(4Fe-4S)-binding protein [Flavobacterium sp.]RZJ73047.1 MAG: hypothetical protein EOO49_05290 [Flavobacterium sp.]